MSPTKFKSSDQIILFINFLSSQVKTAIYTLAVYKAHSTYQKWGEMYCHLKQRWPTCGTSATKWHGQPLHVSPGRLGSEDRQHGNLLGRKQKAEEITQGAIEQDEESKKEDWSGGTD